MTINCSHCGNTFETTEDFLAACPKCEQVVEVAPSMPARQSRGYVSESSATKGKTTVVGGAILVIFGVLLCFVPMGWLLGAPLLAFGFFVVKYGALTIDAK